MSSKVAGRLMSAKDARRASEQNAEQIRRARADEVLVEVNEHVMLLVVQGLTRAVHNVDPKDWLTVEQFVVPDLQGLGYKAKLHNEDGDGHGGGCSRWLELEW